MLKERRAQGEIINSIEYPDVCIQGSTGGSNFGGTGTEDCLKVNVYAPANATSSSKLPVLLYIHGGGYNFGNPAGQPFDHWINQSHNVVIVSVYYRLTSFGFLAHPSFPNSAIGFVSSAITPDSAPADLNVGFLDQIAALQWVHDNIASFGGDPSRVTINGESAGGGSVQLHLVAKSAARKDRLFRGAIAQSVDRELLAGTQEQVPIFDFFAEQAGCDGKATLAATLSCLRSVPASVIARAQDVTSMSNLTNHKFAPGLDGNILEEGPTVSLLKGDFVKVPIIIGATSNETTLQGNSITNAAHPAFPKLTAEDLAQFESVYNISQFSSEDERMRDGTGEISLRCAREVIGGVAVSAGLKTLTYRYNQPNPTQNEPGIVEHAAELWMMFLGLDTQMKTPSRRMVLQQDPLGTTTDSGNFVEDEPFAEVSRCAFVAAKAQDLKTKD